MIDIKDIGLLPQKYADRYYHMQGWGNDNSSFDKTEVPKGSIVVVQKYNRIGKIEDTIYCDIIQKNALNESLKSFGSFSLKRNLYSLAHLIFDPYGRLVKNRWGMQESIIDPDADMAFKRYKLRQSGLL